ncbi:LysR family transcriptional regulator [Rubellimicrobium roseum]|uniref:LysR family transcriptional regulator n=1 Tax=Rubellimicrobium roseum TaxID=687525 RepID=A0A5C4N888_9RHOB|nr:LysR family transcriptional regulator [Rubellimicrobium roseum]TNC65372.1 LysR family transcriptional regulator [Rubellimicrobium roseum]
MGSEISLRGPRLFRGLHYFEAVARLGSVSLAAEETGVSASAVSHQLRDLSAALGEELLVKQGRGIVLTEAGLRLFEGLGATFSGLDTMVAEVVGGRPRVLRLAVCSSFGPAWLAPRLPGFAEANPRLELELRLYSHDPEQTHSVADAIVTAQPIKPGFHSIELFEEMLVAVQSPRRFAATGLALPQLITTDLAEGEVGQDWHDYCRRTGLPFAEISKGGFVRCTHYILALELARAGMGVALVPDFLAAEGIGNGSLAYFDRSRQPSGRTYRLAFKVARRSDEAIRTFARWAQAEARKAYTKDPARRAVAS